MNRAAANKGVHELRFTSAKLPWELNEKTSLYFLLDQANTIHSQLEDIKK